MAIVPADAWYDALPKVELHRHVEGTMQLDDVDRRAMQAEFEQRIAALDAGLHAA